MATRQPGPVVCISYLAAASLWTVPCFPLVNYGAEVTTIEHSIAADGPMVAATLSALGMPALLISNSVGDDAHGIEVQHWLERHGVMSAAKITTHAATPQITVIADDDGTRTWFAYLPGVAEMMAEVDLSPIDAASFVYADCYQLIETSAVRVMQAARAAGIPLLVNLGGSPLTPVVAAALRGHDPLVIQTNVSDAAHQTAPRLAAELRAATDATWAVVTAGAYGAVAAGQTQSVVVPAFQATIRHTHCAGAAFSGGLLYGLVNCWSLAHSLDLACASGALRCERAHHEPMPTLQELHALVGSRERVMVSAA